MPILIDTYNAIHAGLSMGGAMSGLTVRDLCRWLDSTPSIGRQKITLVMDGRPKPDEPSINEFPSLHLVYSGTGISADDVIAKLIAQTSHRKSLIVVTNDRAVRSEARSRGAKPKSCEDFLTDLIAARRGKSLARRQQLPAEKSRGTSSPGQTERWLKEFGFEDPSPTHPKTKPKTGSRPDPKTPESDDDIDIDAIDPKSFF